MEFEGPMFSILYPDCLHVQRYYMEQFLLDMPHWIPTMMNNGLPATGATEWVAVLLRDYGADPITDTL